MNPLSDPARLKVSQTSFTPDHLQFGTITLQVFPNSNISFKTLPDLVLTKEHQCLLDNLWSACNRQPQDKKYYLACLNALSNYFHSTRNQFKFYVVTKGKLLRVLGA